MNIEDVLRQSCQGAPQRFEPLRRRLSEEFQTGLPLVVSTFKDRRPLDERTVSVNNRSDSPGSLIPGQPTIRLARFKDIAALEVRMGYQALPDSGVTVIEVANRTHRIA